MNPGRQAGVTTDHFPTLNQIMARHVADQPRLMVKSLPSPDLLE